MRYRKRKIHKNVYMYDSILDNSLTEMNPNVEKITYRNKKRDYDAFQKFVYNSMFYFSLLIFFLIILSYMSWFPPFVYILVVLVIIWCVAIPLHIAYVIIECTLDNFTNNKLTRNVLNAIDSIIGVILLLPYYTTVGFLSKCLCFIFCSMIFIKNSFSEYVFDDYHIKRIFTRIILCLIMLWLVKSCSERPFIG